MAFGIDNKTGKVIGVDREKANEIVERLSSLCRDGVEPVVVLDHTIEEFKGKNVLLIHVKENAVKPVHLAHKSLEESYIRSGSTTRKASRQEIGGLMLNSKTPVFEELHATKLKTTLEVLSALDYATIFKMLGKPVPLDLSAVTQWMQDEKMIAQVENDGFYITNFGALAAAHNLNDFDGLARKSVRVIKYEGRNKSGQSREFPGSKGYGISFEGLLQFLKTIFAGK